MKLTTLGALRARATIVHSLVKDLFFLAIIFRYAVIAASQFAYLYYALKVCTLFVKKKYILLSM